MTTSRESQRRSIGRKQRRAKVAELLLVGRSRVSIAAEVGVVAGSMGQ